MDNTAANNESTVETAVEAAAEAAVETAADAAQAPQEVQPVKRNIFGKPKKQKPKKSLSREILEWVLTIVVAVLLAFVIRSFIGELVSVDGNSMYATLHNHEVMVVDKLHYGTAVMPFGLGKFAHGGQPTRFDVVICHYPGRGDVNFVKRVVGLPGDQLAVEPELDPETGRIYGVLYVNGERYDEPYLVNRINYYLTNVWERGTEGYKETVFDREHPYTVPEGKYFVLGDNRSNSNDSHLVGPIERNMVIGRVFYIIIPSGGERARPIPNGLDDTHTRVLESNVY